MGSVSTGMDGLYLREPMAAPGDRTSSRGDDGLGTARPLDHGTSLPSWASNQAHPKKVAGMAPVDPSLQVSLVHSSVILYLCVLESPVAWADLVPKMGHPTTPAQAGSPGSCRGEGGVLGLAA